MGGLAEMRATGGQASMSTVAVKLEKQVVTAPPLCNHCAHPIDAAGSTTREYAAGKGWYVSGGYCSRCLEALRFSA